MRRPGSGNTVEGGPLRRKRLAVVVTAVLLAILLVPATARAAAGPTRVLITGDSITSGWVGDYTWRYHFSTARPDLDLVGNKTGPSNWGDWDYNGSDANFDSGHAPSARLASLTLAAAGPGHAPSARLASLTLAEGAGFEPAVGLPTTAFKAVPIGRSGTPPRAAR